MNDLGEACFSSPTDPTNVMKDWARSDDDQRHRLVISASVNSPMTPAGRPFADGSVSTPNFDVRNVELIPRNSGTGSDFFTVSLRVSRAFALGGGRRLEGLIEAFNLTNRVNPITRNSTFGPGSYPSNPVPSFNTVTAVGDPRSLQFGVRFTF